MIGIFDEHDWKLIHGTCAIIYFISCGLYICSLAHYLDEHKASFPESDHTNISRLKTIALVLTIFTVSMLVSIVLTGANSITTPLFEWLTVLTQINFFCFMSFSNPFYDSVHPFGTLVSPQSSIRN